LWDAPAATALLIKSILGSPALAQPISGAMLWLALRERAAARRADDPTATAASGSGQPTVGRTGTAGGAGTVPPPELATASHQAQAPRLPPSSHAKGTLPRRASALTGG
jgi:hypothetical protein